MYFIKNKNIMYNKFIIHVLLKIYKEKSKASDNKGFLFLPKSLQYCTMYFVIGEFPLYGGAQETLALRLQISRIFTSSGEAGTSKYTHIRLISKKYGC